MGRANKSKNIVNPVRDEIDGNFVVKYESAIVKVDEPTSVDLVLDAPSKPLGSDNDFVVINDTESKFSISVNGIKVDPGAGLFFRWIGHWYLLSEPTLVSLKKDLDTLGKVHVGKILADIRSCNKKISNLLSRVVGIDKLNVLYEDRIKLAESGLLHTPKLLEPLNDRIKVLMLNSAVRDKALSGNLVLSVLPAVVNLVAEDLNSAEADSYVKAITTNLRTREKEAHRWASFSPAVVTTEAITDADISAPTVVATPKFREGSTKVTLVFDTDGGVEKTYAAPSSLTGTMEFTTDGVGVTGTGTSFTTELSAGDYIWLDSDAIPVKVESVTDNTNLVLASGYAGVGGGGSASKVDVVTVKISVAEDNKLLGYTVNPVSVMFVVSS